MKLPWPLGPRSPAGTDFGLSPGPLSVTRRSRAACQLPGQDPLWEPRCLLEEREIRASWPPKSLDSFLETGLQVHFHNSLTSFEQISSKILKNGFLPLVGEFAALSTLCPKGFDPVSRRGPPRAGVVSCCALAGTGRRVTQVHEWCLPCRGCRL